MQMRIYHTNDIHGNLEFLRRVQAWLALNRVENDFYFDSGDYMDLKSIVVQADRGESAMKLMAACGLDAMTVGNNEIDLGSEALERLTAFPLIGTNIVHNDATAIPGLPESRILERCGKRFLILGLSPYYKHPMVAGGYNVFFEMGNLHTIEPVAAARAELERQKGKYDFCIALSHSGKLVDSVICQQLPEVDLWLEGHCHSIITEKRFTQSGMGETLGELTLEIDETGISCIASRQIELPDAETESFSALVRQTQERADAILSSELETVGELAFDPLKESPLTNFLCDSLRKHFGGDLALMHSGISEKALTRIPQEPHRDLPLQAEPHHLPPFRAENPGGGKAVAGRRPYPAVRQGRGLPGAYPGLSGLQLQCDALPGALRNVHRRHSRGAGEALHRGHRRLSAAGHGLSVAGGAG